MAKQNTFACYIDFKKAFDCVSRKLLWQKLQGRFKADGKFLSALKSLYTEVKSAVDVNKNLTPWFGIGSGGETRLHTLAYAFCHVY